MRRFTQAIAFVCAGLVAPDPVVADTVLTNVTLVDVETGALIEG